MDCGLGEVISLLPWHRYPTSLKPCNARLAVSTTGEVNSLDLCFLLKHRAGESKAINLFQFFAFIWNFSSFGAISFKSFRTTSRSSPTAAVSAPILTKVPPTQLLPSLLPSFALFSDISASSAARISSVVYCCCLLNLVCLKLTKTKGTHSVTLAHKKKTIQSEHNPSVVQKFLSPRLVETDRIYQNKLLTIYWRSKFFNFVGFVLLNGHVKILQ